MLDHVLSQIKILIKRNALLYRLAKVVLNEILNYLKPKYRFLEKRIATMKDGLFFKYFYRGGYGKVKIVLVDLMGYPLHREKDLAGTVIRCGLGPLLENMEKFNAGIDFDVTLIINTVVYSEIEQEMGLYITLRDKYKFIDNIIVRNNVGRDFGAYNEGFKRLRESDYKGDVLFVNTSVRGPDHDYWLLKYAYMFKSHQNIGLCGISINSYANHLNTGSLAFKPHVQSFFLYTNMTVLTNVFGENLPASGITSNVYNDYVTYGEIEFSQKIIESGYGICSKLFDHFIYFKDAPWMVPLGDLRFDVGYGQFAHKI